jgi:hypothetical protein
VEYKVRVRSILVLCSIVGTIIVVATIAFLTVKPSSQRQLPATNVPTVSQPPNPQSGDAKLSDKPNSFIDPGKTKPQVETVLVPDKADAPLPQPVTSKPTVENDSPNRPSASFKPPASTLANSIAQAIPVEENAKQIAPDRSETKQSQVPPIVEPESPKTLPPVTPPVAKKSSQTSSVRIPLPSRKKE